MTIENGCKTKKLDKFLCSQFEKDMVEGIIFCGHIEAGKR
jgi:hypothetical protein